MTESPESRRIGVHVENVGGIDDCSVEFEPGLTVLVGENATGRTSLLRAIAGVLGGSRTVPKTDAREGRVRIDVAGEGYERRWVATDDGIRSRGTPYLDDSTVVDTFVSLLADNPARRAVERQEDLRPVLMAPVDTEALQSEIRATQAELEEIRDRLGRIEERREQLASLERRRNQLEEELADVKTDLASVREEMASHEPDPSEAEAAEELVAELDDRRREHQALRDDLASQRASLQALKSEREAVELELSDVDVAQTELSNLTSEIRHLRERERAIADAVVDLQRIVEFNESVLSGETPVPDDENGGDQTSEQSAVVQGPEAVECWTCGSRVARDSMETRLEEFRARVDEREAERRTLQDRIEKLRDRKRELEGDRERESALRSRLESIEDELTQRERRIEDLEADRTALEATITELEGSLEDKADLRDTQLLDHQQRVSDLEYRRGRVERELSELRAEINEREALGDERDRLVTRESTVESDLDSLRSRVEDLELTAVETFDEHVAALLDRLAFENIERVTISRTASDPEPSQFDLVVVRTDEDGEEYEDSVATLSESEREVLGLVVGIAGYLTHEVHESVPILLLDSLEAIDADRIARLLDYVRSFAPYVVVALLPEDAHATDATDRIDVDGFVKSES